MSLIFDSLKSLDETGPVTMVQAPFNKLKWHEKVKRRGQLSMSLILIAVATIFFVTWIALSHLFVGGGVAAVSVKTDKASYYDDGNRKENKSDVILTENEVDSIAFEHDEKNTEEEKNIVEEKNDGEKVFAVIVESDDKASGESGLKVVPSISPRGWGNDAIKKTESVVDGVALTGSKLHKSDQTLKGSLNKSAESTEIVRKVERQLIEELRQKILTALVSNNRAEAELALISLTELLGDGSPFVQKMSAFFYLETKQYKKALEAYQRILIKDAQDNNARMQIAKTAAVLGKHEVARKQLIFLVEQKEYRSDARLLLNEISNMSDEE